jgi:hypothetical protein
MLIKFVSTRLIINSKRTKKIQDLEKKNEPLPIKNMTIYLEINDIYISFIDSNIHIPDKNKKYTKKCFMSSKMFNEIC